MAENENAADGKNTKKGPDKKGAPGITVDGKKYEFTALSFWYKRQLYFAEELVANAKENEKLFKELVANQTNSQKKFVEGLLKQVD